MRFSTGVQKQTEEMQVATAAARMQASKYADTLIAAGGTNIKGAIDTALQLELRKDSQASILFLTDGRPTVGEDDPDTLIEYIRQQTAETKRTANVFVFGVGSDVNTRLLDALANLSSGARAYVEEGESIDEEVGNLFDKIRSPLLRDLKLKFSGINVHDVFPARLPALYEGRQAVVTARYSGGGAGAFVVEAQGRDGEVTLAAEHNFPNAKSQSADFLPRLWAQRKIGTLLDSIRINGRNSELVSEVIRLSRKHGIATPYTSYLVLEGERHYAQRGIKRTQRRSDGTATSGRQVASRSSRAWTRSRQPAAEPVVENPVVVHEEVDATPRVRTESDVDRSMAKGQEDAVNDIPLGGSGVSVAIGIGGGGAGAYGFRNGVAAREP